MNLTSNLHRQPSRFSAASPSGFGPLSVLVCLRWSKVRPFLATRVKSASPNPPPSCRPPAQGRLPSRSFRRHGRPAVGRPHIHLVGRSLCHRYAHGTQKTSRCTRMGSRGRTTVQCNQGNDGA